MSLGCVTQLSRAYSSSRQNKLSAEGTRHEGTDSGTLATCLERTTRSAGTPPFRHLCTACVVIPKAFARLPMPPDCLMASSTIDSIVPLSQPQVEKRVNLPFVARLNRGFHAYGMSPLGKTIQARLARLGKTQAWLAEEVGVSEQAVSKWMRTGEISRDNSLRVSTALEMSIAQLLDPNPAPELDERWHSFPPSLKQRVLALVDEIISPPPAELSTKPPAKSRRRA
jgi:transcriptional regulator with XRE-family HTH domain